MRPQAEGRRQRGMTLIEVVIGLAILMVASLGLVAAVVSSIKAGAIARQHTTALAAAQREMEGLLGAPSAELTAYGTQTFGVAGLDARRDGTPIGEVVVDPAQAPLFQIDVRVRWLGPYGDERVVLGSKVLPR